MASVPVPDVISGYLKVAAKGETDALVQCFTEDAEVLDEDQTFEGHDEIRRWRETVTSKFTYTIEPLRAETTGSDGYVVTAKLEGNFPGSPVELQFQFRLRDGLIARLEIAP